jgi:hypothetical protein
MRCDACGQYRLYRRQPMVTLRRSQTGLTATVEPEETPESEPEVMGRYHVNCYEAERERNPRLPLAG